MKHDKNRFFLNLAYYYPTAEFQLAHTVENKKYLKNKEQVLGIIYDGINLVHNLYIQLQRIYRIICISERLIFYLLIKIKNFSKHFLKKILISFQEIRKRSFRDIIY